MNIDIQIRIQTRSNFAVEDIFVEQFSMLVNPAQDVTCSAYDSFVRHWLNSLNNPYPSKLTFEFMHPTRHGFIIFHDFGVCHMIGMFFHDFRTFGMIF